LIGHRVSISGTAVALNVGRGLGLVDTRSPKHEDRNSPDAAAADRVMNVRRVMRFGNIGGEYREGAADRPVAPGVRSVPT
jgi:hypothetical protein